MSEYGHEERTWRFYVGDMIEFCEKALSYTNGLDQAAFIADKLVYDATLRNLELIGEARPTSRRRCETSIPISRGAASSERETSWPTAI